MNGVFLRRSKRSPPNFLFLRSSGGNGVLAGIPFRPTPITLLVSILCFFPQLCESVLLMTEGKRARRLLDAPDARHAIFLPHVRSQLRSQALSPI